MAGKTKTGVRIHDEDGTPFGINHPMPVVSVVATTAITTTVHNVTTTAGPIPTTALAGRVRLEIWNAGSTSTAIIWVGASTVATNTGWPIFPNSGRGFDISDAVDLYAIANTTTVCRVAEYK